MMPAVASFPGGSAYAMVRDIAEGYFLVTERTFARFDRGDLGQIQFEIDRYMREVRGDQPPLDDMSAIQKRNRKIQRLNTALMVLRSYQQKRK
jgi:hypothetical protein